MFLSVCELTQPPQNFVLRGVCLTSNIDSVCNEEFYRVPGLEEGSFPLGLHPWYFLASNCTDPGLEFRYLYVFTLLYVTLCFT